MYYDYSKARVNPLRIEKVEEDHHSQHLKVVLPSPFPTNSSNNDLIYIDCLRRRGSNTSPPLVFHHGLGTRPRSKRYFLSTLKKVIRNEGSLLFLTLPYHLERAPKGKKSGEQFINMKDEEAFDFFRQAVIDTRYALDWWENRFGEKEFYLMGTSLGSLISLITMALDDRFKKGVFVCSGGNYEKISWSGLLRFLTVHDCDRLTCKKRHQWYLKTVNDIKDETDLSVLDKGRKCFLYDPLTFAHWLRRREIRLFNPLFDLIIPRSSVKELWERTGRPSLTWLPCTHQTTFLFWWYICRQTRDFFYGNQKKGEDYVRRD